MNGNGMRQGAVACLACVCLLAGCSGDSSDRPPQAEIVYPEPGHHATSAPDSVVVEALDDRGVNRVEIFLNDESLSTIRQAPYITRLPLGIYADGRPLVISARAYDTRSQVGEAQSVTITIDPSLQTVPQITSLRPSLEDPLQMRLAWLPWPDAPREFSWQVAWDDGFARIAASGSVADTTVLAPRDHGVFYARVRADGAGGEAGGWSRTARYVDLQAWRTALVLAGSQLGAAIHVAATGSLAILSHGAAGHAVVRTAVQMVTTSAQGDLLQARDILPPAYLPVASLWPRDDLLLLAGWREAHVPFLAGSEGDGGQWIVEPTPLAIGALLQTASGEVLALGADHRADRSGAGGLIATVGDQGVLTIVASFPLAANREVRRAWPRQDGGFVLAGQVLADAGDEPAGIWALGLSAPRDAAPQAVCDVLWNVRLGSADRWLLCGAGDDQRGNFVLAGLAMLAETGGRYGFLAGLDDLGRVRWQVTDRDWHGFAAVAADVDGRWVAAGARRRALGGNRFEFETALRGLSPFGATRWEAVHRAGPDARAWSLAAHPGGGWYVAGARRDGQGVYDIDLLRVDDRGALP